MSHVVRNKPWGTIDVDTNAGSILVQERWLYSWTVFPGQPAWTVSEKRRFHHATDTQIWKYWSRRVTLRAAGSAPFCRRFNKVSINFDVRWVLANPHWRVSVMKLPPGSTPTTYISHVDRQHMQIRLDSADLASYRPCNDAGRCKDFRAVPHEFGHTFPGVGDEYISGSPHLNDTDSIMNIGNKIRDRHLKPILDELNAMIANCKFSP